MVARQVQRLKLIKKLGKHCLSGDKGRVLALYECECGHRGEYIYLDVKTGKRTSCGCDSKGFKLPQPQQPMEFPRYLIKHMLITAPIKDKSIKGLLKQYSDFYNCPAPGAVVENALLEVLAP